MTTEEDGNSLDGTPPEQFVPELERAGAAVIGVNCSVGPAPMLETIERIAARLAHAARRRSPTPASPRDIEGRNIYLSSPEYLASYARRFVQRGVRLVGGCCGTTPEHIRQIRLAVRGLAPSARASRRGRSSRRPPRRRRMAPVPRAEKSRLAARCPRSRQVVLVELEPPQGARCGAAIADCARRFAAHGVDAVSSATGCAAARA